jgi:hypothetical protein
MHFINSANKSTCVLLVLARVLVLVDAVAMVVDEDGVVEVLPAVVAAALASFADFPIYLLKQTGDL